MWGCTSLFLSSSLARIESIVVSNTKVPDAHTILGPLNQLEMHLYVLYLAAENFPSVFLSTGVSTQLSKPGFSVSSAERRVPWHLLSILSKVACSIQKS